ncbi:MAG: protein kinase [Phycisphaerae bacterium]
MDCPRPESIEAFVDGELTVAEDRLYERHVCGCDSCLQRVASLNADRFPAIPEYVVLNEIGSGGFGRVFRAVHTTKRRVEALKIAKRISDRMARGFENEVHLIAQLQHPNIAMLYEARLHDEPRFFAMQYIDGVPLDQYLARSGASFRDALLLLKTIVEAIGYAHRRGIAHRDIKPQNILVTADGTARIVDFGIGKRIAAEAGGATVEPGDESESPAGTLGYMAPEQMFGHPSDARSDIFSLGVLLFHLATGKPAKGLQRSNRLARLLRARRFSRPLDLAAIIAHATADDPDRRYKSCDALADDLGRYLENRAVSARSETDLFHRASRAAGFALQHYPVGAMLALTVASVALLLGSTTPLKSARWVLSKSARAAVTLVSFSATTRDAIRDGGFVDLPFVDDPRVTDLRGVHGLLMRRLSQAGARAVVWDYFFRECAPDVDAQFAAGIRDAGIPAVAGTRLISADGEPEVCPELASAFYGIGTLAGVKPSARHSVVMVPVAIQRQNAPLLPSLAVLGMCAASMPGYVPYFEREKTRLEVRYRSRSAASGTKWAREIDFIPFAEQARADTNDRVLLPDDVQYLVRIPIAHVKNADIPIVPYEEVLRGDLETLRTAFDDRIVLVGQMIPPNDYLQLRDGTGVFGCQIQAATLATLLNKDTMTRVSLKGMLARIGVGAMLGTLCGCALARRRRILPRKLLLSMFGVMAIAWLLAVAAALGATHHWILNASLFICAFVFTAAPGFVLQQVRDKQIQLSPRTHWEQDASTLSSRHMIETATLRFRGARTKMG